MSFPKAERFRAAASEGPAPNTYELPTFDRQAGRQGRATPGMREPLARMDARPRALPSLSTTLLSRQSARKALATVSRLPVGLEEAGERTRGGRNLQETKVKEEEEKVEESELKENREECVSVVMNETAQSESKTTSEAVARLQDLEKKLEEEKRLRVVAEIKAEDAKKVAGEDLEKTKMEMEEEKRLRKVAEFKAEEAKKVAGEDLEKNKTVMEEQRRQLVVMLTRLQMAEREAAAGREVVKDLQERLEEVAKAGDTEAKAVKSEENTEMVSETDDEDKDEIKIEVQDIKVEVVEGCSVGVSVRAGRSFGEALQVLRVEGLEEAPRSGSRMDFGEKQTFFQKKIEAEVASPAFRERHERIG